ncbi:MAG: MipA/OmpV family protein [Pseudomonadota bacterium]
MQAAAGEFVFVRLAVSILFAGLAAASPARAEKPIYMFGLGPAQTTRFEGSDEYREVPFVFAQIRWGSRYFVGTDGGGLRADVVGWRFIEAGPEVSFRFGRGGDSGTDDPVLDLLPEVERSIEAGGFFAMNFPAPFTPKIRDALTLDGSYVEDVTSGHDGYLARVSLRYRGKLSRRLAIQAGPFATYGSEEFMNAFYDVTPEASLASGLDAFDADEGWKDYGGRATVVIGLWGKWRLITTGTYRHYINDAAESPIVAERGERGVWFGGGAISRSF